MKIAIIIGVVLAVVLVGAIIALASGNKKKKLAPPPPILPKQYHDRYPKRSGFLEKGMLIEDEQPSNSPNNSPSEKHEN